MKLPVEISLVAERLISDGIEVALGERLKSACPMGGGCIGEVYRVELEDGAPLVRAPSHHHRRQRLRVGHLRSVQQLLRPNWGEFEAITRSSPGNHEYQTVGAAGYCGLDVKASGGHGITPLYIGPNVECTHFTGPPPPK